jgi:hypothetical protein
VQPGLPDGLFSNQKSKVGLILQGLAMEDVGIFRGHLIHFTVFCYISWPFGIVGGNLVYFFPFWYFVPRKIWQPCVQHTHSLGSYSAILEFHAILPELTTSRDLTFCIFF